MTVKKFRPSWFLTVAAAAVIAATVSLAAWQFDRAAGKRVLEQAARAGLAAAPLKVRAGAKLQPFRRAVAIGRYLPEKQILLDNRVHQRHVGYHVITPFLLDDGLALAVNRGWLVAGKNRATPPVPVLPQARPGDCARRFEVGRNGCLCFIAATGGRESVAETAFGRIWRFL